MFVPSAIIRVSLIAWSLTAAAGPAAAQIFGSFARGDCGPPWSIVGSGGEVYAVHVDGVESDDWLLNASAKDGPEIQLSLGDHSYNVGPGFTRSSWSPHLIVLTLPDGSVAMSFQRMGMDWYAYTAKTQRTGDSPVGLPGGAGLVLPEDGSQYIVDLGAGPASYPKAVPGGVEVAFAPLIDLGQGEVGCSFAPGPLSLAPPDGFLSGYNVYRLPDRGAPPTREEMSRVEAWQAYLPLVPPGAGEDTLVSAHDPDGLPRSGDEVLVFHDAAANRDGSPRVTGTPPDPSGNTAYWYAFQPVLAGELDDWAEASLARGPVADYRADANGDGYLESVDLDPAAGNGPEIFSPQAPHGLPGLGFTNGGFPVLSAAVLGRTVPPPESACANGLDDDGDSLVDCADPDCEAQAVSGLRVTALAPPGNVELSWTDLTPLSGPGTSYEVAADRLSTLHARRVADAPCIASGVIDTTWADATASPDDGTYYLVRALTSCGPPAGLGWGRDSAGTPRPACP